MGYSLESLENFFCDIGEKKFRAKQLLSWIHKKGITNFNLMTDFNKDLRIKLQSLAIIEPPKIFKEFVSEEGTKKFLIELESGSMVEMVIIPEKNRKTLCISSQAGCALQCTFCATGAQGFEHDLKSDEIIGQLWLANFYNKEINQITNVVFMGMGEPLLNYDLRDEIVPINKKYPIKALLDACKEYLSSFKNKKTITMEYILIDGINDSIEHAKQLAILLSDISCKINLIPFNNFKGATYKRPSNNKMSIFKKYLMDKGFITTLRITRGDSVAAACGQLVGDLSNTVKGKNLIKHRSINER